MTAKIFTKEEWVEALEALKDSYNIFVPVKEGDFHNFRTLNEDSKANFDFQNTRLSPKSLIQPQSERMFEYTLDEADPEAHVLKDAAKDIAAQAIVGIRPCDAYALQLVKINFDNPEYRDPGWTRRYEATTLVGLGCNDPCATCLCTSVGTGPFGEKGLDVLLYDLGENLLAKSLTEKGEALLKKMLRERAMDHLSVESGGIAAFARDGALVSLDARLVLRDDDIHLSPEHTSTDLKANRHLVTDADLILAMTREQVRMLYDAFPEVAEKEVYTLKEFAGVVGDIEDPAGQDESVFAACRDEIKVCLEKAIDRLA